MKTIHVQGSGGGVTIPLHKMCSEHQTTWFSCWRDHFTPWLRKDPAGWPTRGETVEEC